MKNTVCKSDRQLGELSWSENELEVEVEWKREMERREALEIRGKCKNLLEWSMFFLSFAASVQFVLRAICHVFWSSDCYGTRSTRILL